MEAATKVAQVVAKTNERVWLLEHAATDLRESLGSVLHLPGHRGNPERRYGNFSVTGTLAPAPFSDLSAGVLLAWSQDRSGSESKLKAVMESLKVLGLAWKIDVKQRVANTVEIRVSRVLNPRPGGAHDLVSLADVGFGVSQVLPVMVALVYAVPGQLVYIEQPEIHLHPTAQIALADAIVMASARGVFCVVETHSDHVLTAFQMAVARGQLLPKDVICHWFERDEEGSAKVISVEPARDGALGRWPVDFADVAMKQQAEYIRTAQSAPVPRRKRQAGAKKTEGG